MKSLRIAPLAIVASLLFAAPAVAADSISLSVKPTTIVKGDALSFKIIGTDNVGEETWLYARVSEAAKCKSVGEEEDETKKNLFETFGQKLKESPFEYEEALREELHGEKLYGPPGTYLVCAYLVPSGKPTILAASSATFVLEPSTKEKEAKEKSEREAKEKAERIEKELAEQEAKERAEREAKEKSEQEAKEAQEHKEHEATELKQHEETEAREVQERKEREATEKPAREAKERETKERTERELREVKEVQTVSNAAVTGTTPGATAASPPTTSDTASHHPTVSAHAKMLKELKTCQRKYRHHKKQRLSCEKHVRHKSSRKFRQLRF
jgi:hypothetical protein